MKRKTVKTTKILFDKEAQVFFCVKCMKTMEYNFGYENCPYCGLTVTLNEKRK